MSGSRHAVVLSGGGAKGAYEVGVLSALFAGRSPATGYRPLDPEVFTGTSVGSYNASYLASRCERGAVAAIGELTEIWRRRVAQSFGQCGNGVFRIRGAPLQFLDLGCLLQPLRQATLLAGDAVELSRAAAEHAAAFLRSTAPLRARLLSSFDLADFFSPEPLYELIADTVDWPALARSAKTLVVAASSFQAGSVRYFDRDAIANRYGPSAIAASAAIPGMFPAVVIDGEPLVDGGVLANTPLGPAIAAGADVLHVIYLDPAIDEATLPEPPNTVDTMYRTYEIMIAALFKADIAKARAIANEVRLIETLEHRGVQLEGLGLERFSRVLASRREGDPYRKLEIHKYRPSNDLGGGIGLLAFEERFVDRLIRQGERDASQHDCEREGCVLHD